ncbi:hypothetical protein IEO21_02333 [Rhodonia placenta]|uniref:Uncharacterized protein n=1 Tax=Rhodonia placenta TaxID=104341 RepID=A0A8H7U513_9APHY|nr:hypothetical protein IEO21_02333 [Postia placenta]
MTHIVTLISSPYSARLLFALFPGEPAALPSRVADLWY